MKTLALLPKLLLTGLTAGLFLTGNAAAQTVLWSDNFNDSTDGALNGQAADVGGNWTVGGDAQIAFTVGGGTVTADFDGTGGNYSAYAALGLNNLVLSSQAEINWAVNIRRTDSFAAAGSTGTSEFDGYSQAMVLAGTDANLAGAGNGYFLGLANPDDGVQDNGSGGLRVDLYSYSGGINGTVTNLTLSQDDADVLKGDVGSNYLSLRVNYVSSTDTWTLFAETSDTAFSDPTAASTEYFQIINDTYVDSTMVASGLFASSTAGGSAPDRDAVFDNASMTVVPEPSSFALILGALGLALVMIRRRR